MTNNINNHYSKRWTGEPEYSESKKGKFWDMVLSDYSQDSTDHNENKFEILPMIGRHREFPKIIKKK